MSWTRLTSISVTNGSAIVTVNSGSTINIKVGDALLIGGFDLVEIEGVFANQLQLGSNWNHATQSNVAAAIVPTFGDFNHAVEEIRKLRQATTDNLEAMEQWWTKPEGSVVFQSYDGKQFEARSVQQMEKDVSELEAETRELMGELAAVGYFQTESVHKAIRERNKLRFAASGFVYPGMHWDNKTPNAPINEGLYTDLTTPNSLLMGRGMSDTSVAGNSPTRYPVFNAAGVLLNIIGMNLNSNKGRNRLLLPSAPDGTVTCDSATGVVTDFKKDAGHYAGVAGYETAAERALLSGMSASNEAVCSAYEGHLRNGDFRFGDNGLIINETYATYNIADGTLQISNTQLTGGYVKVSGVVYSAVTYEAEFVIDAPVDMAVSVLISPNTSTGSAVSGTSHNLVAGINRIKIANINFTASGSNGSIMFRPMTANETISVSNIALRPTTTEVVTKRVDMVGVEIYDEEVTNGEVFPHCIQNTDSSVIEGVPMRLSTRPKSYFQTYTGQYADGAVNDEFYCWAWEELTAIQKAKVGSYLGDAAYVNSAGNIVQWRVRARSFAGAGNGDWVMLDPTSSNYALRSSAVISVKPQGMLNVPTTNNSTGFYYSSINPPATVTGMHGEKGLFESRITSTSYSNECYFYVMITIPRLNQGAYSLFNREGTRRWNGKNGDASIYNNYWHAVKNRTLKEAFLNGDSLGSDSGGFTSGTGLIGGNSGHPDGRFFDAIYPYGLGGVVDHRLKYGAWDASSSEQAAVVREEIKNGKYRGREKLKRWMISEGVPSASSSNMYIGSGFGIGDGEVYLASKSLVDMGYKAWVYIVDAGDTTLSGVVTGEWYVCTAFSRNYQGNVTLINPITGSTPWITAGNCSSMKIIVGIDVETKMTVEGDFFQTDVIGDPANILQTDALKNGWLGGWINTIPDGVNPWNIFEATRNKISSGSVSKVSTSDNGSTWTLSSILWSDITNSPQSASPVPADRVELWNYTAFAKQTTESDNLPVINGESSLSSIHHTSHNGPTFGGLLVESVLGVITKGDTNYLLGMAALQNLGAFQSTRELYTASGLAPTHSTLNQYGSGTDNDSHGAKFLFHQINESGQANLNIIANELVYDDTAGDWGDNSKVKILENSTFTDLNNNKCKATIHKLAKPYGFIKNTI